jgi:hypothetical protein
MVRLVAVVVLGFALSVGLFAIRATAKGAGSPAEPVKVEGRWNAQLQLESITGHPVLTFKQDGGKLSGTYEGRYGASPLEGEVKENQIAFVVSFSAEGTQTTGAFEGTVDGATMSGKVEFEGAGSGTWSAVRAKADPPK